MGSGNAKVHSFITFNSALALGLNSCGTLMERLRKTNLNFRTNITNVLRHPGA